MLDVVVCSIQNMITQCVCVYEGEGESGHSCLFSCGFREQRTAGSGNVSTSSSTVTVRGPNSITTTTTTTNTPVATNDEETPMATDDDDPEPELIEVSDII